ncbi:hypothetical protein M9Y10_013363 [Tritrichomonas musculus]|uniref:Intimal thickness related receptor IRP domain-containing protein n=1 Tax=Tritrichomonas musculus TaxID=1915356 RepID=A0ABR2I6V8_9EUKA
MILFLFFLLYKRSYVIQTWGEKAILDQFGFLKGSQFHFNFTQVNAKYLFVSLCTYREYRRLSKKKTICKLPEEDFPKISAFIPVVNQMATFFGNISQPDVLYPVFSVCDHRHAKFRLNYIFKQNDKLLLDSRMIPSLKLKPISLSIFSILGIIWVVNWILNRKVKNSLHSRFSLSILFSILHLFFQTLELYTMARSDSRTIIFYFRILSEMLQLLFIYMMILMISNGICSIHLELPFINLFECFAISFVVAVPSSFFHFFDYSDVARSSNLRLDAPRTAFKFECFSIFIALRLYFLLKYIQLFNISVELFFKDNILIELDEIEKKTKEFRRFKKHFSHILFYLIFLFVNMSLDDFRIVRYWISQLSQDSAILLILCESGWISRLQSVALVIEAENLENRNGIRWEQMRLEDMHK